MSESSARALAAASASLVVEHDVVGTLSALLVGTVDALDADASGILVADSSGRLELLAASSHEMTQLALYEGQHLDGPGVESWSTGKLLRPADLAEVTDAWPAFGAQMQESGFAAVMTCALRWNDSPLGSVNVFRRRATGFSDEDAAVLQAFADMATLVIIHTDRVSVRSAAQRVEEALNSRITIEQAKGVLAQRRGVSMSEAFDELRRVAHASGATLTDAARTLVRETGRGTGH